MTFDLSCSLKQMALTMEPVTMTRRKDKKLDVTGKCTQVKTYNVPVLL